LGTTVTLTYNECHTILNVVIIFVELTQIFEHKFYVRICLADGLHISIVGMHIIEAVSGDLAIGSFWFVPRQLNG
jgi:hypothetical protein